MCVYVKLLQSCLILCDLMDYSPSGSSVQGVLQARTLEWFAMPSFKRIFLTQRSNLHLFMSPAHWLTDSLAPPRKPKLNNNDDQIKQSYDLQFSGLRRDQLNSIRSNRIAFQLERSLICYLYSSCTICTYSGLQAKNHPEMFISYYRFCLVKLSMKFVEGVYFLTIYKQ